MFKIPFQVSQIKKQPKLYTKNKNKFILGDKIVNKNTDPTLFNVQNAALAVQHMSGTPSSARPTTHSTTTDIEAISVETLIQMNVGISGLKKDFSLLEDNNPQIDLSNPSIIAQKELDNVSNDLIKPSGFDLANDPIYELDAAKVSATNINDLQDARDFFAPVDPSQILSGLNIMNQSSEYFGRNKYYEKFGR